MALSDAKAKNAKPQDKPYKLADEKGLYLLVRSSGKYWRFDYRHDGKRKTLALGVYPEVGLKAAREKRDTARQRLADGIDPSAERQAAKFAAPDSFEAVAREWLNKFSSGWTPRYTNRIIRRLEINVFPFLANKPIGDIAAPDLLTVIRRIEARGVLDTAHRALQDCGQIFRYAVATGRAERDPSGDLRGAIPPAIVTHYASITDPKAVGALLRAIEGYKGSYVVGCALRLAPLVFVRPGELRHAEWTEFDLDQAEWRISAGKMKMRQQHIVPLSRQVLAILADLRPLTGAGRYLFPSERTADRPISENTLNAALRRLGYGKDEMCSHGFRSMSSTLLNEQGWNRDAIERQLAHVERDSTRSAYNYAQYLPERRRMMQAWSDYLDTLKVGANIIAFGVRR